MSVVGASRRLRASWSDICASALGLALSAVSLAYPFGWDQGVNYYVAREWLLRGAVPYRDSFDHRMPGIYVIHAACLALFGESMWGIRLAELGCVVALGLASAYATTRVGNRPSPGVRGVSIFAVCVLYYGFFDFWNTAQCEIWSAMLSVAGVAWVHRRGASRLAWFAAGLAAGAVALLKTPAVLVIAAGGVPALARVPGARRRVLAILDSCAGALVPVSLAVAYFAARHALASALDILVGANWAYVNQEPARLSLHDVVTKLCEAWRYFAPLSTVLFAGLVVSLALTWRARARAFARYLLCAAMCVSGACAVVVQRKFYLYHWALMVGPLAMLAACWASDAMRLATQLRARWVGVAVPCTALFAVFGTSGTPFERWLATNIDTVRWLSGALPRDKYDFGCFSEVKYGYRYDDREKVGLWLREHARPGDRALVRGVAAEVYAVSGLHATDRFFWTPFLTMTTREYRREAWLREDREAIERDPPRFVVAFEHWHDGPDSPSFFRPYGYVVRTVVDGFVIMERPASPT